MTQRPLLNRTIALLTISILFLKVDLKAQHIEQVVTKFKSIQNIEYSVKFKEKDLFSDSIYNGVSRIAVSKIDNMQFAFRINDINGKEVFDGNKRIKFNLPDSTYRILSDSKVVTGNYKLIPNIVTQLNNDLSKGFSIKETDSIILGKAYYKIKITERDTLVNNKRTFRFITVLFDKENFLPYSYRDDSQGFIDGTNTFLEFFSEYNFNSYEINKNSRPILIEIPNYFALEKQKLKLPLLNKGSKAPELELFDSLTSPFKLANQKGKTVLLNFSLNGCPHCVESIEMLNSLSENYNGSEFLIVSINPFDNKQSIANQSKKFGIKYPTFVNPIDGKGNIDKYHIQGYPTFYLIDKRGNIVKGFEGYSSSIARELNGLIKESIGK